MVPRFSEMLAPSKSCASGMRAVLTRCLMDKLNDWTGAVCSSCVSFFHVEYYGFMLLRLSSALRMVSDHLVSLYLSMKTLEKTETNPLWGADCGLL